MPVVTAAEAYGLRYGLWEAEKLIRFHEITVIIKSFTVMNNDMIIISLQL